MYRINIDGSIAPRAIKVSTRALMLLVAIALLLPATGGAQELERLNHFVQGSSASNSAAIRVFRVGRDQIQEREWNKAAETFREFIRTYPTDRNVDAALYYLAFALKNEAKYQEALLTLERIIKEHSGSGWKKDAEAMVAEILAARSNDPQALEEKLKDADTEVKIIALQGLFQKDADRAAEYVVEYFKPDSKANLRLKQNALHLLGQYRGKQSSAIFLDIARRETNLKLRRLAIYWLGRTGDESVLNGLRDMALTAPEKEITRAAVGAIAQHSGARPNEILSEIARNTSAPIEVRKAAIEHLGRRSGEVMVDELMKIYNVDQNEEIRKSVVQALSWKAISSVRDRLLEIARSEAEAGVRREAIRSIIRSHDDAGVGEMNRQKVSDILIQLYGTEQNVDVKMDIISSLARLAPKPVPGQHDQDAVTGKLTDIARNDPAPQLRERAIYELARRNSEQAVPMLIQFYDAEKSEEVKERILSSMCRSANKQALRKLMEVAKSDTSIKLRKSAVTCLGRSKDPEAAKFLEEILK